MDPENEDVLETGADEVLGEPVDVTPEVDAAAADEKPVTMEETLRAKYKELTADPEAAKALKPEVKPAVKPETPVEVKPGEPARGPDGKFVTKPEDAAKPLEAKPGEVKPPEVKPAVADPNHVKAPTSWKGEAQAKWEALPAEIKAEVHRRESDFHNGLKAYKQKSDTFDMLDAEIRPYEAMIRASGTNAVAAIKSFFNTAYMLKTGTPESRMETWLGIGKEYGVDLALLPAVQEKLEAGVAIVPPEYRQLEQRFNQLSESVEKRDAREKQERADNDRAEMESVQRETTQWSVGKEHYEAVRLDMAALMESGRAKDLDDAYNKATWAHPEVRAKLIAQQQETERVQAAEKAAAARKAASTNVKPRGTPLAKPANVVGTMEDTLRAAYKKLTATQ